MVSSSIFQLLDKNWLKIYIRITTQIICHNKELKLNNNKSPGPDNIGPKLIKFVLGEICDLLQYIYNLSFQQGTLPEKLWFLFSKVVMQPYQVITDPFLC